MALCPGWISVAFPSRARWRRPGTLPNPRTTCSLRASALDQSEYSVSVSPPADLRSLPYPGESTNLTLRSAQLRDLATATTQNSPPKALLYLPATDLSLSGALLSVSSAQPINAVDTQIEATTICRARISERRFGVVKTSRVYDWVVWEHAARISLAKLMVTAEKLATETKSLRENLANNGNIDMNNTPIDVDSDHAAWARLRATSADQYDLELQKDEWEITPKAAREFWCRRAELFSFACVRFAGDIVGVEYSDVRQASVWNCTDTHERLKLAVELLIAARGEAAAKNSLKNALGGTSKQ